jgi:hypothetical protein
MVEDTRSIKILEALAKVIRFRGYNQTLAMLANETKEDTVSGDPLVVKTMAVISKEFGIEIEQILCAKNVRGDQKFAIGFCVYFLYEKYSLGEIKKYIFKERDKSALTKYRQLIDNLNPRYKNDKVYIEKKIRLTEVLKTK